MARRYYSSTAVATTLSANANNSTTSITVATLSGFPVSTPWTAIIDADTVNEEVVEVTNVAGTTLTVTRGVDGTTAVAHNAGAVFRHGVSARDFDEANSHVNDTTNDVHSQYVTKSLVDAKGDIITATADNTPARLPVGTTDGHVLKVKASASTGLEWGAPAGPIVSHYFTDGQGSVTVTVPVGKYLVTTDANDTVVSVGAASVTGKGPQVLNVTSTGSSFGVSRPQIPGAPIEPTTWTTRTSGFGATNISALTFGNALYVAGGDSATITTSTDAITWTTRTSGFGDDSIRALTFGNSLYVAAGTTGKLATSTDGITWTSRTSNFSTDWIFAAAFGNGIYLVGGGSGKLATSTDGITWTTRTSGFGVTSILALTYGGIYVAGGNNGLMTTSTNGVTWTSRTAGLGGDNIRAVGYMDGIYLAGGDNGKLTTSTDAITWTTRTSGFGFDALQAISGGNGIYLAGGDNGKLTTSTDAITWTTRTSGFGVTLVRALTFGNSVYVAAGFAGTITTSQATSTAATDQPTGVVVHALTDVT